MVRRYYDCGVHRADCYKAFGFLSSKEVKNAGVGNLGLQDRKFVFRVYALRYLTPHTRARSVAMDKQAYRGLRWQPRQSYAVRITLHQHCALCLHARLVGVKVPEQFLSAFNW